LTRWLRFLGITIDRRPKGRPRKMESQTIEKIGYPYFLREKQIDKVVKSIGGMHGDLEGINGPSLPVVKMLELNSQESIEEN